MFFAVILSGCKPEPSPLPPSVEVSTTFADLVLPTTPRSAATVRFAGPEPMELLHLDVVGPSGTMLTLSGEIDESRIIWRPPVPWAVGEHRVTGVVGTTVDESFTIEGYGADPHFLGVEAGDAWSIDLSHPMVSYIHPDAGGVIRSQVDLLDVVVEVLDVTGHEVTFRVVLVEDDAACSAHTAVATASDQGWITSSVPELVFPLGAETTGRLFDLELSFGLLDGELGGGVVRGMIETEPLDGYVDLGSQTVCGVLESFGDPCVTCPEGGLCAPIEVQEVSGASLVLDWHPGAELAQCAAPDLDVSFDIPPIDCSGFQLGCSTSPWGASWLGMVLFTVLARRR